MKHDFADLHEDLRAVARDILGASSPLSGGSGPPVPPDWDLLARSGWLGLEVPEHLDGAGATFGEVAVLLREMGAVAAATPYLGSAVLGLGALQMVQPGPERDQLLRSAAVGGLRLSLAGAAGDEIPAIAAPFVLERSNGAWRIQGESQFVPDASEADRLLLLASGPEGVCVVEVDPSSAGVSVSGQPVIDSTRRLAVVRVEGAAVGDSSVWEFAGDAEVALGRLFDRAALAVACDSLGLAGAMMDATVAYAGIRHQFGRPIGSFQAVKHACADMLVQLALCQELVSLAVADVCAGASDGWIAVARAKAQVCESAVQIAGKAVQLHGGVGYTWESGLHVYLKRAALNRSLFGSPSAHRRRLGTRFVAR